MPTDIYIPADIVAFHKTMQFHIPKSKCAAQVCFIYMICTSFSKAPIISTRVISRISQYDPALYRRNLNLSRLSHQQFDIHDRYSEISIQ